MRLLLRLVVVLIAGLASWLGSGTPVAIGTPTSASHVYAYDSQHNTSETTRTIAERGPPAPYDHAVPAYTAVVQSSQGASARPQRASTRNNSTYDHLGSAAQAQGATATTRTGPVAPSGDLCPVSGARCAAKSADEVLGALSYSTKIEGQMATRGWTKEAIEATIQNPTATHTVWDLTSGIKQAATAYVQRGGGYVVLNDEPRAVVQIGNLNKTGWKPVWEDPRFKR